MIDGIATGWHHALWLLGYVLGAVVPVILAAVALLAALWLAYWGSGEIAHRVRVIRLRRQARRTGRTT